MYAFRHFYRYIPYVGAAIGGASFVSLTSHAMCKEAECSGYDSLNSARKKYPASEDYPDLSRHQNIMASVMTPRLYAKLRDRVTSNGVTLDHCIQVGVDNPGHPLIRTVGMFAGDEESYSLFPEVFDPVIDERHGGYKATDKHTTDLSPSKVWRISSLPLWRKVSGSFFLIDTFQYDRMFCGVVIRWLWIGHSHWSSRIHRSLILFINRRNSTPLQGFSPKHSNGYFSVSVMLLVLSTATVSQPLTTLMSMKD